MLENPYLKEQALAKKQQKKSLLTGRKTMKTIPTATEELEPAEKTSKKHKSKRRIDEE